MKYFTHLHLHTSYSLNSGTIKIDNLINIAKKKNISALAITDYLNIFGAVKFYNKCIKAHIKPIIGCEIPFVTEQNDRIDNIVLLCQNINGYHNLNKILSSIHRSRSSTLGTTFELLNKYNSDLLCLSGARNGLCGINSLQSPIDATHKIIESMSRIFPDRFYIEVDRTNRANENEYNNIALALAKDLDLPIVASNDVLFINDSDYEANEVKVSIIQKTKLEDRANQDEYSSNQYFKSQDEMSLLFQDQASALTNISNIVERCNFKFPKFKYHLPNFSNPTDKDDDQYFRDLCDQGLNEYLKLNSFDRKKYTERLDDEISVIQKMGFASYFLIVQEFISWAKDNDVPVGPGRGSGAGSLVAFVLGITNIDPLKYNLLFERFLNPERISMPDFDIDFCMNKRQKVIDHIIDTYGQDKVSQIITYSTLSARAVIRDVGRVLDYSYGFVDYIAKLIPFTLGITIDDALKVSKELKSEYKTREDVRLLIDLAKKIEGLPRGAGTHAAGIVISPSDITDFMPIYSLEDKNELITQFDKDDIESLGLVKFDILGLTTLTIMDEALRMISNNHESIRLDSIPLDDQKVFNLLKNRMTTGIFQLESLGMKKYMAQLQPDRFEDIVALVALYRPGPLGTNMVDDFIANKHGAEIKYEHPLLENILSETNGLILYQEQVMEIAKSLGNYTLGDADLLRRAMGKKKQKEMENHRSRFVNGCSENGISENIARSIFDKMEKFAGYGFNKSHSVAYAMLSYQTAYLKAYYPTEFFSAALSSDMDNTNKIINLLTACNELNIKINSPNINSSTYNFQPSNNESINYGLCAIKGVGENAAKHITDVRLKDGLFINIKDFCSRVNLNTVNSGTIESLISSGCFDSISEESRTDNIENLDKLMSQGLKTQLDLASGQSELFTSEIGATSTIKEKKLSIAPPSNDELIKERKVLGYYLSSHPINKYKEELNEMKLKDILQVNNNIINNTLTKITTTVSGVILDSRSQKIGKNKYINIFKVDDGSQCINISFFEDKYLKYKNIIKEDTILFFNGEVFIDDYNSQLSMRAESVFTLDVAREKYSKYLRIVLSSDHVSKEKIYGIKEIISKNNSGKTKVILSYKNRDVIVPVSSKEDIYVNINDKLLSEIRSIAGYENVEIKYQ